MEDSFETRIALQHKLDILKKNREAVTEKELLGKYGRAYMALTEEINQLKTQFIVERVRGIYVRKDDPGVQEVWNAYLSKINSALYDEYSVDKAEFYLEDLVRTLFLECNSIQTFEQNNS